MAARHQALEALLGMGDIVELSQVWNFDLHGSFLQLP